MNVNKLNTLPVEFWQVGNAETSESNDAILYLWAHRNFIFDAKELLRDSASDLFPGAVKRQIIFNFRIIFIFVLILVRLCTIVFHRIFNALQNNIPI